MRMRIPTDSRVVRAVLDRAAAVPIMAAGVVMVVAGCGGSEATTDVSSASPTAAPSVEASPAQEPQSLAVPPSSDKIVPVGPVWLKTDDREGLGTIVVDGSDRTVYFSSQETDNVPACYDACANTWLPLLTDSDPAGGIGIQVAAADTVPRRDGSTQASFQGHPLYYFAGDTTPRQVNGHGVNLFGATWYAMTPDGDKAG